MRLVDYLDKGASLGPEAPCLTTDGAHPDLRRGAGHLAQGRRRPGAMRSRARAVGGDPVGQRPDVVHVRLRDLAGRRRVVPDQPAQRGGREPRAARPLRLHRPAVPGVVRAARRGHRAGPAQARDPRLPRRRRSTERSRGSSSSTRTPPSTGCRRADAAQPRGRERGRRPRDDRRHRRHHRSPQGRDADQRQPRDDDGADADGLPVPTAGRRTSPSRRSPTPPACCASRCSRWAARS